MKPLIPIAVALGLFHPAFAALHAQPATKQPVPSAPRTVVVSTTLSPPVVRTALLQSTLIGQSAEDLGENADSIVNSCSSFLFLKDPTFNRKRYAELFRMNEQQLALFESLQDREALYIRRDGLTKVVILNLDNRSYATFSTKPKDRVRRSKLIAKYRLAEGINRFAQGELA